MTDSKRLTRGPAPPDHKIYQLGFVIGSVRRNRLPEGTGRELKRKAGRKA